MEGEKNKMENGENSERKNRDRKKRVWIKGGRIRIEGQCWRWDEKKKKLEKEGRGMGERLEVFRGKEDEGRKGKREKEGEEKEEGWKGM